MTLWSSLLVSSKVKWFEKGCFYLGTSQASVAEGVEGGRNAGIPGVKEINRVYIIL